MLKHSLFLVIIFGVLSMQSSLVMAAGDVASGEQKTAICATCHGPKGISSNSINPNLAGQVPGYIAAQLAAFKSGERVSAIMEDQSKNLSTEDMADLDAYYASLPGKIRSTTLSEEDIKLAEEGGKIYRGGYAQRGISACMGCHGPSGHGIPKNYPRVSAQHKEYIEQQLLAYKKGDRKGYNEIMSDIAFGLSELQIKQLSAYIAGLQ